MSQIKKPYHTISYFVYELNFDEIEIKLIEETYDGARLFKYALMGCELICV